LEPAQNELENEHRTKLEQLSSQFEEKRLTTFNHWKRIHLKLFLLFSNSMVEDYEKQIQELQQKLSEKDNERNALSERLHEVEVELTKTLDDHTSTVMKYESLIKERDELAERHSVQR
jgi:hypothetical protein